MIFGYPAVRLMKRNPACAQAAKKARDFLIRKLKRRLVLLERAEMQEAEASKDDNLHQEDAGKTLHLHGSYEK